LAFGHLICRYWMKNFLQKQKETVTVVIYICVIAGLVYFVIRPLLASINSVHDQIQEEGLKQEIVKQRLNDLPKIQDQYDMLQKNEGSIDILLDENNAVVLIERLETLAQDSGDKINITVQNQPEQKNTQTPAGKKAAVDNSLTNSLPSSDYMQLKITLTGKYNSIVNFIYKLESFEYYCDITAIQIQPDKTSNTPIADSGVLLNPFNVSGSATAAEKSIKDTAGNIEASLDVVFYTKE
jgi:hypothetical protein